MASPTDVQPDGELASQSLVELALSQLRAEILSGALEPGERLVEEQLTRRFGISRAPVREALRLLAEQGLVDHLPRRGVRVTTLSERDFDELFAVRDALEQFAIGELIRRSKGRPDVSPLAAELEQLSIAAQTGDRLAASQAHRAFHLALVALAGSRQLTLTYEPVILKLQLYMAANLRREADERSPSDGEARHRRLLEVIEKGDPELARLELAHHGARSFFH
ncbi:transcriptional regulator, GntR family [Frankineae bacterium MT45]|nr:transcriptional regulator, GntR family [Frankineae bacterium MT45]